MLALSALTVTSYRAEDRPHLSGSGITSQLAMLVVFAEEVPYPAHILSLAFSASLCLDHPDPNSKPGSSHAVPYYGHVVGRLQAFVHTVRCALLVLFLDAQCHSRRVSGECLTCGRRPGT